MTNSNGYIIPIKTKQDIEIKQEEQSSNIAHKQTGQLSIIIAFFFVF